MYKRKEEKKYATYQVMDEMVEKGNLGVKYGVGLYDYSERLKSKKVAKQFVRT